jgi:DNA-binding CsgD family transcriptional regulator
MAMLELMEREAALEGLRGTWPAAIRGRGSVAWVTGEAGIGKTALVTNLAGQLPPDTRVLWGFCDELATPRPLGAIRDLAEALPGSFAHAVQGRSAPEVIHRLLLDELRTDDVPTVLIIEDAQWADQATMDCLTVIGRRVHDLPVLLVVTFRSGEADPDHPLHGVLDAVRRNTDLYLDLAPLSYEAVATLAGEDADRVFEIAGGNPFFVTEMIAHDGTVPPPSLANAVLWRVARLGADTRALLELVSIVPARVRMDVLDRLEPGWPIAAEPAERRGLLATEPRHIRFRHELARTAIRSSVPPGRRRLLHRRVLETLVDLEADAAEIVHHAEAAGDHERLTTYGPVAARDAAAAGSNREAFAQFQRAVAVADRLDPHERAAFEEEGAHTADLVGHTSEAISAATHANELHEQLGRPVAAGRTLAYRSQLHWFTGDGRRARDDTDEAIELLRSRGPPAELARALVRSSELAMLAGDGMRAREAANDALALAEDDPEVSVRAQASIGAMRMQHDPDDTPLLLHALESAQASDLHDHAGLIWTTLSYLNLQWVRPEAAESYAEAGRRYAREHEVDTLARYLDAVLAWSLLRRGDGDRALRLATDALDSSPTEERTVVGLQARTVLTELAIRRGGDDAEAELAALRADADRTGELKRIGPVLELEIEHALTRDQPLPNERFGQVRDRVAPAALHDGYGAARLAAWAEVCGVPHGFTGRAPEPHATMLAGDWQAGADAFGSVGWTHDQALLLSLLDDADALAEALRIAHELAATPLERHIARRMRELDLAVPRGPQASTRENPAHLTDRQLEVLALLRDGGTNAEIARALNISPRTVEHHVSAIFARLEVSSRAEAVARSLEFTLS